VDVQAVAKKGRLHHEPVHVGSHAEVEVENEGGTLGALMNAPDGSLTAILSGHVAQRRGLKVKARALSGKTFSLGQVQRVLEWSEGDAASAGPVAPSVLTQMAEPATDIRTLTRKDMRVAVYIRVARDISPRETFVGDVGVTMPVAYRGGTRVLTDLIATTQDVTEPGDSGAPAVDWEGNLVGFVVGSLGNKTYLMPAGRALDALFD
jgi:hypothetical protein